MSNRYPKFIMYKIELMIPTSQFYSSSLLLVNGTTIYWNAYQGQKQGTILDFLFFPQPLYLSISSSPDFAQHVSIATNTTLVQATIISHLD